jgi:5-methylcytosine-specific restriction endonuclease McrA
MSRQPGTDSMGFRFRESVKMEVWKKAIELENRDARFFRNDRCGRLLQYDKYGNRQASTGWEIDHILSVDNGGGDEPHNLQPLHWENNEAKGDNKEWSCPAP